MKDYSKKLKEKFASLSNVGDIELYTFNFNASDGDIMYSLAEIEFKESALNNYLDSVDKYFSKHLEGIAIEKFNACNNYESTVRISIDDKLVNNKIKSLKTAILNSKKITNSQDYNMGFLIKKGDSIFVSLSKPFKVYKHILSKTSGNKYVECNDEFLVLKNQFDIEIDDENVFMFNNRAEKFFDFDRSYYNISKERLTEIKKLNFIKGIDKLFDAVNVSTNAKKFYNFKQDYVDKLCKNKTMLKQISKQFNIPTKDGKFVIEDGETAKKLIKVLCDKAKIDPFDNMPVQVPYSKPW